MKIIVPIDFSENSLKAFEFALFMADKKQGKIILLHVIELVYDFASQAAIALDSMFKDGEESLQKLKHKYASFGVEIETRVLEGTASITIARVAEEEEATHIVVGTQGESGLHKTLFGSTAVNVLREASCPVLIVPAMANFSDIRKVTLALEFANHEKKFIDWIVGMSQRWDLALEILHVQTNQGFKEDLATLGIEAYLTKNYPGLPVRIHTFYAENASEGLDSYLNEHQNMILVMCHEHKNLWNQILHQSQSIKMAYHTHIPLLIMN